MPLTKRQELGLIVGSLSEWQLKHCKSGNDQDLRVDGILSLLDDLSQDIANEEGEE